MYEVIKMWLWILEDPLVDFEDYAYYGLPLYKTVALKYGFFNPIGEDTGKESYYEDYYYEDYYEEQEMIMYLFKVKALYFNT